MHLTRLNGPDYPKDQTSSKWRLSHSLRWAHVCRRPKAALILNNLLLIHVEGEEYLFGFKIPLVKETQNSTSPRMPLQGSPQAGSLSPHSSRLSSITTITQGFISTPPVCRRNSKGSPSSKPHRQSPYATTRYDWRIVHYV